VEEDKAAGGASPLPTRPKKVSPSAWLPFLWAAFALSGAVLMMVFSERLTGYGLVNQIYYLVLVTLGLGAGGALFAGFRSTARYRGQHTWGYLEMSGPPVVFFLVLGAGMYFAPGQKPFGMTVFVHGPGGPQDLILRNQGRVALDLGPDRRIEQIGEKGTAYFAAIPPDYRGQSVPVSVIADGYSRTDGAPQRLSGESLYVTVKRNEALLEGVLTDESGEPVTNAVVEVGGITSRTNSSGRFRVTVPGELVKEEMTLDVRAEGFVSQTVSVVPGSNEIRLTLKRRGRE
jgi:hypothetical protein